MRLKFVKGKQRELIKEFKDKKNLTWKEFCELLNIKYGKILAYLYETSCIDEVLYKKLDIDRNFEKYILERKEDNWGKRKGGLISSGKIKKIKEPEESEELAEFYGAMLGDGNSHRTKYYNSREDKRGVYMIRIVGDSRLDRKYHLEYLKPLIEDLFSIKVNTRFFKEKNAMLIEAFGVKLVEFLEKKGFPPGDKIKNQLRIPDWVRNNPKFLRACLRGIFDTDGSIYELLPHWPGLYQISLTCYNQKLINDVREGLTSLGIICSKISRNKIYITKKSELRKFLKLIGFSNNRHLRKIKMWNLVAP